MFEFLAQRTRDRRTGGSRHRALSEPNLVPEKFQSGMANRKTRGARSATSAAYLKDCETSFYNCCSARSRARFNRLDSPICSKLVPVGAC